jgi:hypothetical protein
MEFFKSREFAHRMALFVIDEKGEIGEKDFMDHVRTKLLPSHMLSSESSSVCQFAYLLYVQELAFIRKNSNGERRRVPLCLQEMKRQLEFSRNTPKQSRIVGGDHADPIVIDEDSDGSESPVGTGSPDGSNLRRSKRIRTRNRRANSEAAPRTRTRTRRRERHKPDRVADSESLSPLPPSPRLISNGKLIFDRKGGSPIRTEPQASKAAAIDRTFQQNPVDTFMVDRRTASPLRKGSRRSRRSDAYYSDYSRSRSSSPSSRPRRRFRSRSRS